MVEFLVVVGDVEQVDFLAHPRLQASEEPVCGLLYCCGRSVGAEELGQRAEESILVVPVHVEEWPSPSVVDRLGSRTVQSAVRIVLTDQERPLHSSFPRVAVHTVETGCVEEDRVAVWSRRLFRRFASFAERDTMLPSNEDGPTPFLSRAHGWLVRVATHDDDVLRRGLPHKPLRLQHVERPGGRDVDFVVGIGNRTIARGQDPVDRSVALVVCN